MWSPFKSSSSRKKKISAASEWRPTTSVSAGCSAEKKPLLSRREDYYNDFDPHAPTSPAAAAAAAVDGVDAATSPGVGSLASPAALARAAGVTGAGGETRESRLVTQAALLWDRWETAETQCRVLKEELAVERRLNAEYKEAGFGWGEGHVGESGSRRKRGAVLSDRHFYFYF